MTWRLLPRQDRTAGRVKAIVAGFGLQVNHEEWEPRDSVRPPIQKHHRNLATEQVLDKMVP